MVSQEYRSTEYADYRMVTVDYYERGRQASRDQTGQTVNPAERLS